MPSANCFQQIFLNDFNSLEVKDMKCESFYQKPCKMNGNG